LAEFLNPDNLPNCNLGGNQEERMKRGVLALDPNITFPAHTKNRKRLISMLSKKPRG
jgi:hypothetical protein